MGKKVMVTAAGAVAVLTVMSGVISSVYMALRVVSVKYHAFCTYRPSPAMPCGVVAAALALTTHIFASTAIGWCGAWRTPKNSKRIVAVLLFVVSWILAIKVVILFMVGAMLGYGGYVKNIVLNGNCIALGIGVFMVPTILFLIVVSLEIALYILLQKSDHHEEVVGGDPSSVPTMKSKAGAQRSAPAPANKV